MSITDSVLVVRNSIVRDSDGLFAVLQDSEVLFDRSLINNNDFTALSNWPCCAGSTVSYVNSTITGHEAQAPFNVTIGELEGALINIANSTVVNNGPHAVLGPIDTRSSIIDSCSLASERRPPADFAEAPIDLGGNVGGCFGDGLVENFPLDDYGCAVPAIMGCVPTIATTPSSPARGAGECESTLIADPNVDLFAIDVATLPAGTDSVLTTIGRQTVDGRGFPRTSCDSGAYESDGNEPAPPETFTVATLDLDHPFSELNVLPSPSFYALDIVEWAKDSSVDVLLLQRVASGPLGSNTIDALMAEFERVDHPMIYDYVPAFDLDPEFGTSVGQVVFTRFPIVQRGSTALPNPNPGGEPSVIQEVQLNVPVRIVNVRTFDGDPCGHIRALNANLENSGMTTIVGGNLGADRTRDCVGEFTARWVDACALEAANELCERTVAVGADDGEATQDYLLHTSSSTPVSRVWAEAQPFFVLDPFTPHWPVVAEYSIVGGPSDADGDGIDDPFDQCPSVPGSGGDRDNDGVGDICDPVLDGDANCDDTRDIIDALLIAQFEASVRTSVANCPLGDPTSQLYAYGADANNDGTTDIIDALLMAQCSAAITNIACPPTPEAD